MREGFYDLKGALDYLDSKNELTRVQGEVDWNLELGTVTREVYRRKGPAILFENIKDYNGEGARCHQLTTGIFASMRRVALMLGFDDAQPNRVLIEHLLERNRTLIKPVMVKDGPVHERVLTGKDINLYDFPVPKWHHLDGGRYIGTLGCAVTKDPDSGIANIGLYRSMIVDHNRMSSLIVSSQGWGAHWAKYQARGEAMPVAWIFGWDPVLEWLGGSPVPANVCEYEVMGGYRNAPAELVRCKTVDLEVPAGAEIVIEGKISPDPATFAMEGPFGEFTGYTAEVATPRPVVQVSAITHRRAPIFRGTLEGSLPGASGENSHMSAIQRASIAWNILRNAGIAGVLDVYIHPVNNGTTVIVQVKKLYEGQPKQIAAALWGSNASTFRYKIVVVVDEDIDPSDYEAVDWAINYRVDPGSDDLVIFRGTLGSALDPSTPLDNRRISELGAGLWNRLLIDATKTWRFPRRAEWNNEKFPPVSTNRPEDVARVREKWDTYGFSRWKREF
ncbi:MAG: UbiD family decarboxylase [Candidatus Binataceae bacterium]